MTARIRSLLASLLVLAPVLALLGLVVNWTARVPEPVAGRAVWRVTPLDMADLHHLEFVASNVWAGFHLLYFGLLALPGVDLHHLPMVSFGMALGLLLLLQRRVAEGGKAWLRPLLLFGLALVMFSPVGGANWLVAERVRVFVPPLVFLLALGHLRDTRGVVGVPWLPLVLTLFATGTERVGFVLWFALLPAVWAHGRSGGRPPLTILAPWLLATNLGYFLLTSVQGAVPAQNYWFATCMEQPLQLAGRWLEGLGRSFPLLADTPVTLWAGVLGLVAYVALLRVRGSSCRLSEFWSSCVLYALLGQLLLAGLADPFPLSDAFARELHFGGFLLPVGLLGMASQHPRPRSLAPVAIPLLVLLAAADWVRGLDHLRVNRDLLRQEEASQVLRAETPADRRLRRSGLFGDLPIYRGERIADYPVLESPESDVGVVDRVDVRGLQGRVQPLESVRPDRILVARGGVSDPGVIVLQIRPALAGPTWSFLGHWAEQGFRPGDVIRVFVYDVERDGLLRLPGSHRFDGEHFIAQEELR